MKRYQRPEEFTAAAESAYHLQFMSSPGAISYNSWTAFQRRLRQARRRAVRAQGGYA